MAKLPTIEQYQEQTKALEAEVKSILATKAGETLLTYLARLYDGPIVSRMAGTGAVDEKATLLNLGAREVYQSLRDLRNSQ